MFYTSLDAWWWPYLFILLAGVLPTAVWRWAGVLLVGNMNEESEAFVFVRCIATALVAAVIAQFIFLPTGALEAFPLWLRVGAMAAGFLAFLTTGRLIIAIICGEALLVLGGLLVLPV